MDFSFYGFLKWATGTVLACISLAGFVIALVNTSLIHEDCGSDERCDNFLRRYWWSLMFQVGIMVVAFLVWIGGGLAKFRVGIVGFLALVTVQHIELVGKLLTALDDTSGWPINEDDVTANEWLDEDVVRGNTSGFTILAFANMVYMIIFGMAGEDMTSRGTTPSEPEKKETSAPPETTVPV